MSQISDDELTFPKDFTYEDRINELTLEYGAIEIENVLQEYTCYNCRNRIICEFAFDEYNLDGDCLAQK